ncbi:39S ribosomal protein L3, mitochondrial-like [Gigantopelta aegis]|uniref:39S ribosomal protein L3, mitochondrial-like n=1 Tax=Gigantopelta aegis TaxID=1735272 RepID=UPI001B88C70D|nr:39S ribosomal protein L3, mitochondrial-like [Gigantopelta aegis]
MAVIQVGNVLCRASNAIYGTLITDSCHFPRVLVNYQQSRSRRRCGGPPSWFVRVKPNTVDENLTTENKEFLSQVALDQYQTDSPLKDAPWERGTYSPRTKRVGVLAIKIGVLPQWSKDGHKFYTTLLQVLDNHVIRYTPPEEFVKSGGWKPWWGDKYGSVVVGALSTDPRKFSKSYNNLFLEAGVPPKRKLTRFLVTDNAKIQPGTPLNVMHFRVGDFVDCQAKTIDYGFQGVVKRWGMKGMGASHGVTKAHRKMGATGGGGDPGRIWKGKRMPGHMGDDWKVLKGLRIWRINTKYNILYVHGPCIPGECHTMVRVYDTCLPRRKPRDPPPMPTWLPEDSSEELPEEMFHDDLHQFADLSIQYEDEKKS